MNLPSPPLIDKIKAHPWTKLKNYGFAPKGAWTTAYGSVYTIASKFKMSTWSVFGMLMEDMTWTTMRYNAEKKDLFSPVTIGHTNLADVLIECVLLSNVKYLNASGEHEYRA